MMFSSSATDSTHDSLLLTKLNRPRLPHDLVLRSRLVEWLNHDMDRPLILVCVPAGFGKSTLVETWLEQMAAGRKTHGNARRSSSRAGGTRSEMI